MRLREGETSQLIVMAADLQAIAISTGTARDRHFSFATFSSNKNFISVNIKGNEKILSYKHVLCKN